MQTALRSTFGLNGAAVARRVSFACDNFSECVISCFCCLCHWSDLLCDD